MAKIQTIDFKSFVRDEYKIDLKNMTVYKLVRIAAGVFILMVPKTAMAATDATFGNVWTATLNIVDWIAVGVFTFAGVSWMFGHRTKGLELLIGGTIGYILARHAMDIRDFLKSI